MTDIKPLLDETVRENEPPPGINSDQLVARGRSRSRWRLIGYTGSGVTFALAVGTAVVLLLPSLVGGQPDRDSSEALSPASEGVTGSGEVGFATNPATLSDQVREAMHTAFPDVDFVMASGWNVGEEPFELTGHDQTRLTGFGEESTDGIQVVGVELYLPGDWSSEPSDSTGFDRDADEFLIDCGSGTSGGVEVIAECDSSDLGDDGLLRTAEVTEVSDGTVVGFSFTSVIYRPDGTAIVLRSECHPEDTEIDGPCDPDSFATYDPQAAEVFLTAVPTLALEE